MQISRWDYTGKNNNGILNVFESIVSFENIGDFSTDILGECMSIPFDLDCDRK